MPFQRPPRAPSVLASALAATGIVLAVAGCSNITPLGPDPTPMSLPPARQLGSAIIMQVMRSQPPTPTGRCPVGSVTLFGSDPNVPRAAVASPVPVPVRSQLIQGSTATPAPPPTPMATPPTPPGLPAGVACYLPVGRPVTITSAAVSSVVADPVPPGQPKGPTPYGFTVAVPAPDVAAVTALISQAFDSHAALGISVDGKLWEAAQVLRAFPGQQLEIALLTRNQAVKLYRLLIPSP
jgi:hypothetical protein